MGDLLTGGLILIGIAAALVLLEAVEQRFPRKHMNFKEYRTFRGIKHEK